jgi:hypothetical protein
MTFSLNKLYLPYYLNTVDSYLKYTLKLEKNILSHLNTVQLYCSSLVIVTYVQYRGAQTVK